jgi:hypothetical protein
MNLGVPARGDQDPSTEEVDTLRIGHQKIG